ncbi:Myb/SANT-like DNA-binding domain-containing protein [Melanogaster broomeanus]|nr:Myb/SANT-like DNA-binding domain-containing protein [Melanogaster broomeanus]
MSSDSPPDVVSANIVTTSNEGAKGLKAVWTDKDDETLVSVLRIQKDAGNQAGNGWKPSVWTAAVAKLLADGSQKGGAKTSSKCSDHWTNLKSQFVAVRNLRGFSGFGWDDGTKMVTAHDNVWKKLKENKTTAKYYRWRKSPFPLYDDILYLVDGIVATGATAYHAGNPPAATDTALTHDDEDSHHPSLNGISPSDDDDDDDEGDDEATQVTKTPSLRRVRARTESPFATATTAQTPGQKGTRGVRKQTSAQAVSEVAQAIRLMAESSGGGPTTPQRLKAAIHRMEDDGDLSDEDIIRAARLFRHDIGIADTYLGLSTKRRRTGLIMSEIEEAGRKNFEYDHDE